MNLLEINPEARWTTLELGEGQHRVVIADDFYANVEPLRAVASSLYYLAGEMHGNFPGARAIISLDTQALIRAFSERWGSPLIEASGSYHPAVFSIILNDGRLELNEAQRQPHVDPGISAMVYLNDPQDCAGGTGIYRHRPTGLERIPLEATAEVRELARSRGLSSLDLDSSEGYRAFQDEVLFHPSYAAEGNSYINDGNEAWELLHLIEMKFNRLVIFDGRMPHSQHLAQGQFSQAYRLNQIIYLKERQAAAG
jgi:uncharacterized protein DUF6445